ncbi:MAG: ABC transporter permease subunit, partial [Planctomycetota bacterium]
MSSASVTPQRLHPESRIDQSSSDDADNWIERVDAFAVRFGDTINPILVKETRQALKSRQFLITFSTLLVAALGWTVAGSLSMMPQIYTTPSAPRMLIGYYVLLAIPMLLIVPLAAYRSLESEIDDGTLELLSITPLSPWQIVLGKLSSACLQMVLYLVTLFPCVAYAYTLRGI